MKQREIKILLVMVTIAGAATIGSWLLLQNAKETVTERAPVSTDLPVAEAAPKQEHSRNQTRATVKTSVEAVQSTSPGSASSQELLIHVKAGQTLASVNGIPITLRDLVPQPAARAGVESAMSADMFRFLLNRAIERELVLQSARAEGLELSTQQKQRLEQVRTASAARGKDVFDDLQQNTENTEFEQRDFTALLLGAALASKAGVAPPYVTPEAVEAFYHQHEAEYGPLASDVAQRESMWRRIDSEIRQKLTPQVEAEYQRQYQQYIERLKAGAKITIKDPA